MRARSRGDNRRAEAQYIARIVGKCRNHDARESCTTPHACTHEPLDVEDRPADAAGGNRLIDEELGDAELIEHPQGYFASIRTRYGTPHFALSEVRRGL
jgi:hypothetical protein